MYKISEDKISKEIDKIIGKLHILRKKKELWGLTEEEDKLLKSLTVEYAKNYYQFIDNIFNDYIEPYIYNEEIIEIKSILQDRYNWNGNLLCFDFKLNKLLKIFNDEDKEDIISLLERLMEEELKMLYILEESDYGREMVELFSSLQNVDKDICISRYIRTRYNVMISMIEEV